MPKKEDQRSGWRTHQRSHKIKKKTQLALIILGLLLALLLMSQIFSFTRLIHHPLRSKEPAKNYTWNGEFNLNLVFRTKPLSLASYNPKEKRITIIVIPDETLIDVPFGFGRWQLRSVYDLAEGSSFSGERLIKQSISSFLGIPVDGISSDNLVDLLRRNLFSGVTLLPKLQTDLTLLELARLKIGLLGVRFDKIKQIDLSPLNVLEIEKLADGTEIFIADPVRLDSILSDFAEPNVRSEHLSVAVFNATEKPLLAQRAKRIIENLGGVVIATQNAPGSLDKSYVDGEKSKTLDRLRQIFDLDCLKDPKCDKIPASDLGLAASRAQIIVVLGKDF